MKYICLRDDDTSFLTSPEQLHECYGDFWGKLPITLAVIPFIHGSSEKINQFGYEVPNPIKQVKMREWQKNASYEDLRLFHTFSPVGENEKLIKELKTLIQDDKIEIAQHGVFHRYTEQGAEMQKSQMSFEWIRDGKEYLEKVFETKVSTFIPPSNTIDKHCLEYLKKLNLNLFSSGLLTTYSKTDLLFSYVLDPFYFFDKVKEKMSGTLKPLHRRFSCYMFGSYTYDAFKSQQSIMDFISASLESTGFAAMGTHYSVLLEYIEYRKLYHEVIKRFSEMKDVEFVTAKKYLELMIEKYYG